ncbi:type II toxin-antitoxin system RelE/ParE family toxin [uncultured Rhodospira sp.]|uniref:type II toxin-antitoxin system RelE/ParE family toxin n=1 Tax=uncultured Rhodospira sp. TaxID=1936189 RepID=UPI00260622A7|nr:type II toxin-antitoxin system RelE/ParE family toxin [uncultured Rhodospira sp.]
MKRIMYAPAALASLEDILEWTIETFGDVQAEKYASQLVSRLEALASGLPPRPRPCAVLVQDKRDVTGLTYYREGEHYLILRETRDTLELVEVFHGRMDIEARLRGLRFPEEGQG